MALFVILLLVLALALFLAAAFGVSSKVNLMALGLAAVTLATLLPYLKALT